MRFSLRTLMVVVTIAAISTALLGVVYRKFGIDFALLMAPCIVGGVWLGLIAWVVFIRKRGE